MGLGHYAGSIFPSIVIIITIELCIVWKEESLIMLFDCMHLLGRVDREHMNAH